MKKQIVIYGAGLAGLTTAIALSRYVSDILILEPLDQEKYIEITEGDSRTTAISANSKNFFSNLGLWQDLSEYCGPIDDIEIIDSDYISGDSLLNLHFSKDDVLDADASETMGYIIRNDILKIKLLKEIKKIGNIEINFNSKINQLQLERNITIKTNQQTLKTNYLLAADGKNSQLRELADIPSHRKDYNQSAITFNIKHEKPHNRLAIERFMPKGPFAVLPMADKHESSIVWTVGQDQQKYYIEMDQSDFISEVEKRLGDYLGKISLNSKILSYPLTLVYSNKYFRNNLILVGDAAHGIHPIAGQGFNQGIKDIEKLSELAKNQSMLGLPIFSESCLEEYQRHRNNDNMQMILATDFFNELFSNDNKIISLARRLGISRVDKTKEVKKFFINKAMGKF